MSLPRRLSPSLAALRAFEALDRLGTASAVARELSLTQSAVSRQIQALEEQLGVALVVRAHKRLVLTPEARIFAAEARAALDRIAQAALRLTEAQPGGRLSLAVLPSFGMRWLMPRLAGFARVAPEITLDLATRLKPFNFDAEPFDAAIFYGVPPWPGTFHMVLRPEEMIPVAAPELAAKETLENMPLLHIASRPDAWDAWFLAHGTALVRRPGTRHDQFSTLLQAARFGLGAALLPDYLAEEDLAAGRLVALGPTAEMPGSYCLVWPEERDADPALRSFRTWLEGEAAPEDMLPR